MTSIFLHFKILSFTSLLAKAELDGRLHGVAVCRNAPCITNLFFADNSLIFCQANKDEVQVVSDTLQLYAKASGQCINLEKSSAYFNSNVSVEQKAWIIDKLKVKEVEKFDAYLGLPTLIGRRKYDTFAFIKERIWKKMKGWKGKLLSRANKEVLIKAMDQSIPHIQWGFFSYQGNYVMNWTLCVLNFGRDKLGRRGKYTRKIEVF